MLTNWWQTAARPGCQRAHALVVPVVVSISLSMLCSLPSASWSLFARRRPPRRAPLRHAGAAIAGRLSSGSGNDGDRAAADDGLCRWRHRVT